MLLFSNLGSGWFPVVRIPEALSFNALAGHYFLQVKDPLQCYKQHSMLCTTSVFISGEAFGSERGLRCIVTRLQVAERPTSNKLGKNQKCGIGCHPGGLLMCSFSPSILVFLEQLIQMPPVCLSPSSQLPVLPVSCHVCWEPGTPGSPSAIFHGADPRSSLGQLHTFLPPPASHPPNPLHLSGVAWCWTQSSKQRARAGTSDSLKPKSSVVLVHNLSVWGKSNWRTTKPTKARADNSAKTKTKTKEQARHHASSRGQQL